MPLSLWRGWWRERSWGFSTQGIGAWFGDRLKALAVSVVLGAGAWAAAVALALAVLLLSLVAPVVLEPLFNRFRPLEDETLAASVRLLSQRAGVPVREVLVADASRRTTKVNAYVSGIGRTRRVVVFDTLLAMAGSAAGEAGDARPEDRGAEGAAVDDPAAVEVVVAHELGHRRDGHVAKLT